MKSTHCASSTAISNPKTLCSMTYCLPHSEYSQTMRFRLVSTSGQQTEVHFLRNTTLCLPWNPQRTWVRREDRYLVDRHHDVRNGGGRKPLQNNARGRAHKDSKRRNKNPLLSLCLERSQRLPGQMPTKEPQRTCNHKGADQSSLFQETPR